MSSRGKNPGRILGGILRELFKKIAMKPLRTTHISTTWGISTKYVTLKVVDKNVTSNAKGIRKCSTWVRGESKILIFV